MNLNISSGVGTGYDVRQKKARIKVYSTFFMFLFLEYDHVLMTYDSVTPCMYRMC